MLILGLVLVLVFATSPTSAASQGGAPSAQLSGWVVEDRTGAPISSAHVILLPQPRNVPGPVPLAITDQDGRYTFEDVPPGRYRVDVQKAGILPAADPANAPIVTLAAGQVIDDWSVSVQRGGAITGRILDPFGEPLADVTVLAARGHATGAVPSSATASSTVAADLQTRAIRTNDLGEFRIFGLAPASRQNPSDVKVGNQIILTFGYFDVRILQGDADGVGIHSEAGSRSPVDFHPVWPDSPNADYPPVELAREADEKLRTILLPDLELSLGGNLSG